MSTNVRATNWPTRDEARLNMPRESRRGRAVASRLTYEARRKRAVAGKLDQLQEAAERHFRRAAAIAAMK